MQLEPSKLHQSSEKKMIINKEQAVSRLGDWIDAAAGIPQTASHRQKSSEEEQPPPTAASNNCVPHHPCQTQGGSYKGFLSKHTTPKASQKGPGLAVVWSENDEADKGWRDCAQLPAPGAKPSWAHHFHCVLYPLLPALYTPWWLLSEPLLLPSPQPCAPAS